MGPEVWGLIGQIVSAVALVAAGAFSAVSNRHAKRVEAQASPYEKVAARVVHLEERVERLERERDEARDERDLLRDEVEALTGQRDALRELVAGLWGFLEANLPPGVPIPFRRPLWLALEDTDGSGGLHRITDRTT